MGSSDRGAWAGSATVGHFTRDRSAHRSIVPSCPGRPAKYPDAETQLRGLYACEGNCSRNSLVPIFCETSCPRAVGRAAVTRVRNATGTAYADEARAGYFLEGAEG